MILPAKREKVDFKCLLCDFQALADLYIYKNIKQRSWKIIDNSNLKLPSAENLIKHKSSQFVFDCFQNNVCTTFKTHLERSPYSKNTRNNGLSVKVPKVRLEFGKNSFHYQGAKIFNELPIEFRSITSRLKFFLIWYVFFTHFFLIFTIVSFIRPL